MRGDLNKERGESLVEEEKAPGYECSKKSKGGSLQKKSFQTRLGKRSGNERIKPNRGNNQRCQGGDSSGVSAESLETG